MPQRPHSPRKSPPRAPSQRRWDAMSAAERRRVVDALPGEVTDAEMSPPEGDRHFQAKVRALDALQGHFRRLKRRVYLAAELPVYFPGERRFAPDLLAVFDVEDRERDKYVVSAEGKGLDVVFEVHVGGDRKKDAEVNVERYARLGVPEYFIYDRGAQKLFGYRLPKADARRYVPVLPQQRRFESRVLGLELSIEDGRLRFFMGNALVFESAELIVRLEQEMAAIEARADDEARQRVSAEAAAEAARAQLLVERALREEAARLRDDEAKRREEETKRREEETKRREAAERRVAELEKQLKAKSRRKK